MTNEQILLEKWRTLPSEKQQKVLEFVETIAQEVSRQPDEITFVPKTPLGKKLWELRQKAIAAGKIKLLDWEGIEKEMAERRGETE